MLHREARPHAIAGREAFMEIVREIEEALSGAKNGRRFPPSMAHSFQERISATAATDAVSRGPLARAYRPFIAAILKGSSGSF